MNFKFAIMLVAIAGLSLKCLAPQFHGSYGSKGGDSNHKQQRSVVQVSFQHKRGHGNQSGNAFAQRGSENQQKLEEFCNDLRRAKHQKPPQRPLQLEFPVIAALSAVNKK